MALFAGIRELQVVASLILCCLMMGKCHYCHVKKRLTDV